MLEPQVVRRMLDEAVFVGQGLEHRVVAPLGATCVINCDFRPNGASDRRAFFLSQPGSPN